MLRRVLNVFREGPLSRDIDRELAFHLAEREDELVASGMPREAARREARRRFGRTTSIGERTRDADMVEWIASVKGDLRYAIRSLAGARAFTLVAVLSLALGIGANSAIFSLINALMLRALPVHEPERLVTVKFKQGDAGSFTNPLWEQIRDHQDAFASVLAYGGASFNLAESGEEQRIQGYWVSGSFFQTLGVGSVRGRTLSVADDVPGCAPVVVVSEGWWRGALGADPRVVGRRLRFGGHPVEVVGVADGRFTGLERGRAPDFYLPLCAEAAFAADGGFLRHRSWWFLQVLGRLRDGETPGEASARLARSSPAWFAATLPPGWSVENTNDYLARILDVNPSLDGLSELRGSYATALLVLMGIAAMVLLIACANVANLMLARGAARQRELAVRIALGAARGRIVRQLFTEGLLLAVVGAGAGILIARWGSGALIALLSTSRDAVSLDLTVDTTMLAFTAVVAVGTAILFGLAPAWRAARVDPQVTLVAKGRSVVEGHSRFRVGRVLVAGQVALSLVLLTCASLLLSSFRRLSDVDAGFDAERILVSETNLHLGDAAARRGGAEQRRVLSRLRALPEVASASMAYLTPMSNNMWNDLIQVPGVAFNRAEDAETYVNEISDGYFSTLGTRLMSGRDFTERDVPGAPLVAIVNETAARRFFRGRDPLGATFTLQRGSGSSPRYEIVGVVADAKYNSMRDDAPPTVYFPILQDSSIGEGMSVVVRGRGSLPQLHGALRAAVLEVAPRATMRIVPLSVQVGDAMARERLLAALSVFFGGLALLLAMIGLYGTMAYQVARRRGEIGIRIALGASRTRVVRDVLAEVGQVLALGVALGLAGALAGTRLIEGFLFGVGARDATSFAVSVAVLVVVALVAGSLPARRAARMDPMESLRVD